jgi:hypothetical protein
MPLSHIDMYASYIGKEKFLKILEFRFISLSKEVICFKC